MFKILTAALIAASVLIAPLASANAATKPATATTKMVKKHQHFAKHQRHKHVKHAHHGKKFVVSKKTRHGKIVKAHRHGHVTAKIVKAPKTRVN